MQSKSRTKNEMPGKLVAKGIECAEVGRYGNDPFFVKKAEAAKEKVNRIGFPPELLIKK